MAEPSDTKLSEAAAGSVAVVSARQSREAYAERMEDYPGREPFLTEYLARVDNPNIMLVIERSKNRNLVVYEACLRGAGSEGKGADGAAAGGAGGGGGAGSVVVDGDKPVDAYWFALHKEHQEERRRKGIEGDRNELGTLEWRLAYGVSWKKEARKAGEGAEGGDVEYKCSLTALPERPFTITIVEGRPRALGVVNGKAAYLTWIYVHSVERMFGIPKVVHVLVYGTVVATGEEECEKIVP